MPASNRAERRSTSPQAGLDASTVTAGGASSPTLRGLRKCSISRSGYTVCSNIGMLQVVAAIIEREGRVLICRRMPRQAHPLKWEFPGGKVEPGETPAQALARELDEQLVVRGARGDEIERYPFEYPGRPPILLIFFRVDRFEGEPRNLIFQEMSWEPREKLREFDFVEGDLKFLGGFSEGRPASILVPMATPIQMADPAGNEFLASLEAKGGVNRFFRTMANRPEV